MSLVKIRSSIHTAQNPALLCYTPDTHALAGTPFQQLRTSGSSEREGRKTQLAEALDGRDDGALMRYARAREKRTATGRNIRTTLSRASPKMLPMRTMLRLLPLPARCEC